MKKLSTAALALFVFGIVLLVVLVDGVAAALFFFVVGIPLKESLEAYEEKN